MSLKSCSSFAEICLNVSAWLNHHFSFMLSNFLAL